MSPNLFSVESDNPMVAVTMSQKVAEFTLTLLNARLQWIQEQTSGSLTETGASDMGLTAS